MKNLTAPLVTLLSALAAGPAQASLPDLLRFEVPSGASGSAHGFVTDLKVTNRTEVGVTVRVPNIRTDQVHLRFPGPPLILAPGASGSLALAASFRRDGDIPVIVSALVFDGRGGRLGTDAFELSFQVERGRVTLLPDGFGMEDGAVLGPRLLQTTRLTDQWWDVDGVRPTTLDALIADRDPTGGDPPAPDAPWGPVEVTNVPRPRPRPTGPQDEGAVISPFDRVVPVSPGCVGGKLLFKNRYGKIRPAFGWLANFYINHGGGVFETRSAFVDNLGEWQMCPNDDERASTYLLRYRPTMGHLETRSQATDAVYALAHSPTYMGWPAQGVPKDLGARWFDFGDASGPLYLLGDVYEAMVKTLMALDAADVLTPDLHFRVYYPATDTSCGGGDNDMQSVTCGGAAYITKANAQAMGGSVVVHELGHLLNERWWQGWPPGAFGPHQFTSCAKPGLALTEGFANFFAAWVLLGRQGDHVQGIGEIETPAAPAGICAAGFIPENHVTALLWDLHDLPVDGADTGAFPGEGDVLLTYLAHFAVDIFQLRAAFEARAALLHPAFVPVVGAIYQQNVGAFAP